MRLKFPLPILPGAAFCAIALAACSDANEPPERNDGRDEQPADADDDDDDARDEDDDDARSDDDDSVDAGRARDAGARVDARTNDDDDDDDDDDDSEPIDAGARDARAPDARDGASPDDGAASATDARSANDSATTDAANAVDPDPPAGSGCSGAVACEGFESGSGESLPSGWKSAADDCSGNGKATIDGAVHHAGASSLRVESAGGYCNHAFAQSSADLAALGDDLWVRFWVRFGTAPGSEHVTFLTMRDAVSGKHLRMGVQSGILMWNREKDDATLPELSPAGIALSVAPKAQTFQCIEFHVAGSVGTLETFVDGTRVPGLVVDGMPTPDVDRQWLNPGNFRAQLSDLRFGWESYGNIPMTVWFDDIAIGKSRPGC